MSYRESLVLVPLNFTSHGGQLGGGEPFMLMRTCGPRSPQCPFSAGHPWYFGQMVGQVRIVTS